jgi:hypothetical protein
MDGNIQEGTLMAQSATGWWRRLGVMLVAAVLVLSTGSALLAQTPPASGLVAVVTDPEGLNLRGGPGTQFPSLTVLTQGSELAILGERVNTDWLPVSYQGMRGFVHAGYIEIRPPGTSTQPGSPTQPGATPRPSPTPSPTPAPIVYPALSPATAVTQNGVTLAGVFAYDVDDMITIADQFKLVAAVEPPPGVTKVTVRLSGAPFLSASAEFDVQPGVNWLEVPNFRVDTENEPVLQEEIIRKVGGMIRITDGALVLAVDFADGSGARQSVVFQPTVRKLQDPGTIAIIEYPDLKRLTGLPPPGAGNGEFFLRGNADFHHPEDYYVRKLAIEAGRNGGVFPDDPELVADNVFRYVDGILGDGEPGDFNNDYNLARLIEEGTIKRGQKNGAYICIGQVYFMTALTRTLGMPSRELNILVGRANWQGNDGVWRVTWWQEGAIHTWYNGRWNHYDTWLGFKGMNGYFTNNLAYQTWAAFDRREVMFMTADGRPTGLRGHDFGPSGIGSFEFVREATRPGYVVLDMPAENGEAVSDGGFGAFRGTGGPDEPSGSPSDIPWPSPNTGILRPPERRP